MFNHSRGRRRRRDSEEPAYCECSNAEPGNEGRGGDLEFGSYTARRQRKSPEEEERLEREHFWKIINTFTCYGSHIHERVNRAERQFMSLPKSQQNMLPNFHSNLDRIRKCADHNQEILQLIVNDCTCMFENKEYGNNGHKKPTPASTFDMDKLKSTIKQFVRDWSEEGKSEREACYQPIISEILKYFPKDKCDPSQINVLIPGAGLGRLAWEIAMHGYSCQGNEWSFFMLFSSNFVLNRCSQINAFKLYPWIHQFSNNVRSVDQVRPVYFPDVNPHDLPYNPNFSMTAGDFQEIYTDNMNKICPAPIQCRTIQEIINMDKQWKQIQDHSQYATKAPNIRIVNPTPKNFPVSNRIKYLKLYHREKHLDSWDCVATCFFIDTAHNILDYVETIWKILKPGGIWINLGPLLYHFENLANELSIEVSYEDLKNVIIQQGFLLEEEKDSIRTTYTVNHLSMMKYFYDCIFFVARKPE